MSKLYLAIMASVCFSTAASGQSKLLPMVGVAPARMLQVQEQTSKKPTLQYDMSMYAKTTAPIIYTEDFGSGNASTLPLGWNTASPVNTNWTWRNNAPLGFFTRGIINSTTNTNGYMILRADSIYSINATIIPNAYLTSPTYDFSSHPTVGLEFQQWYTNFQDSCFVEVSNDGSNWTRFAVNPNNLLDPNEALPTNPTVAKINISAVAGGQNSVQIRFHYMGRSNGAYGWLIDDIAFTALDPVDAGVSRTAAIMKYGDFIGPVGIIPKQFADTVWPAVLVANFGEELIGADLVNNIYAGNTSIYNNSTPLDTLPVNLYGAQALLNNTTGAFPGNTGRYTVTSNIVAAGDAVVANDADSATFIVSDSSWSNESGAYLPGGFWAHYPAQSGNSEQSTMIGTSVTAVPGISDTLTSVSVAFRYNTAPGTKVTCQIYRFTTGWEHIGNTKEKTLTTADLSTTTQAKFTTFPVDFENTGYIIVEDNDVTDTLNTTWAAVVQINGVGATDTVRILATPTAGFGIFAQNGGLSDTSHNDGAEDFAVGGLPTSLGSFSPAIRLNFGNGAERILSADNLPEPAIAASNYPNPANSYLNINLSLAQSANAEIVITNAIGQVVKTQSVGYISAHQQKAVRIATADLAPGMYLYSVRANGQKISKRFVVSH